MVKMPTKIYLIQLNIKGDRRFARIAAFDKVDAVDKLGRLRPNVDKVDLLMSVEKS